ncbi:MULTISPECIES: replication initiator [unclassified Streptomyces]|uniref:replication initiator n=1 Tax=unclassified Streptomyces TaxID=2593676 RepID=UPI00068A629B|nr:MULTISPECIES: replication initiator [unclassified Streptomyces]MCI3930172.1 plasmid replication initiator protein [Streptomyces sp. AN091965]
MRAYPTDPAARRSALDDAERLRRLPSIDRDLIRLAHEPGFPRWLDQIKATGGCARPVYLSGHTTVRDAATGAVLRHYTTADEPGGRMPVRCRNRRQSRCEPCSRQHAGDTYHLVRSGLQGGKGVSERVQLHPRLFLTLTPPGFGAVHRASDTGPCKPQDPAARCEHGRPLACHQRHDSRAPLVGQPLCPDCYDHTGHVLWHACAGRLWNRFCHAVRRRLATLAGIAQTRLREHLVLSFAKVAEFQRRGAVHFHAVIRVDGPNGPSTPPSAWATAELLEQAVREAADSAHVHSPYSPATGERLIRFGTQLDVHPITTALDSTTAVTDDAVAAYIAKYVSKSVGDAGGVDYRITHYASIHHAPVNAHLRALMATCWRLGALPELASLNLRAWTHTLGYRGHVLTKSRRYSTTYGQLRAARADHQTGTSHLDEEAKETVTESAWRYVGVGHSLAEAELAAGVAHHSGEF